MFIALDGGGSRTRGAVFNEGGRRLSLGESGPANHLLEKPALVRSNLLQAAEAACRKARVRLRDARFIAAGLAGITLGEGTPRWFRKLWPAPSVAVWDALAAFRGALAGGEGALIIAGTGSTVYARSVNGREARVGGWGPDVPSEWGADQIARQALAAAVEAEDGRRAPTPLTRHLRKKLALPDVARFVGALRTDLARLSIDVAAFAARDPLARDILEHAAAEMARATDAALRRVGLDRQSAVVSYAGSVFKAGTHILEPLKQHLHGRCPRARVVAPLNDPLYGAYLLAREAADGPR